MESLSVRIATELRTGAAATSDPSGRNNSVHQVEEHQTMKNMLEMLIRLNMEAILAANAAAAVALCQMQILLMLICRIIGAHSGGSVAGGI